MPAQLTTYSASMSPAAVRTPVTRPCAWMIPVTGVFSRMRTPPWRAPFASAWVTSVGLTRASFGK